jgi:hypothetical protein
MRRNNKNAYMPDLNVITTTIYNSNYIPFDLYVIIFIATLSFLAGSIIVKNDSKIILAIIATLLSFFTTYATFILGVNTDTKLIFDNTSQTYMYYTLDTIYTVQPLLILCVGITGICVFNIWASWFYSAQRQLTEAVNENKDIEAPYLKTNNKGDNK